MLKNIDKYFRTLTKIGTINPSEGSKLLIILFLKYAILEDSEIKSELKDEDFHFINHLTECFTTTSCVLK